MVHHHFSLLDWRLNLPCSDCCIGTPFFGAKSPARAGWNHLFEDLFEANLFPIKMGTEWHGNDGVMGFPIQLYMFWCKKNNIPKLSSSPRKGRNFQDFPPLWIQKNASTSFNQLQPASTPAPTGSTSQDVPRMSRDVSGKLLVAAAVPAREGQPDEARAKALAEAGANVLYLFGDGIDAQLELFLGSFLMSFQSWDDTMVDSKLAIQKIYVYIYIYYDRITVYIIYY